MVLVCSGDFISARLTFRPFKVIQDHWNRQSKVRIDFLLVHNSNLGPILHRFGDFAAFCAPDPTELEVKDVPDPKSKPPNFLALFF